MVKNKSIVNMEQEVAYVFNLYEIARQWRRYKIIYVTLPSRQDGSSFIEQLFGFAHVN